MEISYAGLSHRTAPISMRERLAVPPDGLAEALRRIREETGSREAVILGTCNRVEVYLAASGRVAPEVAGDALAAARGVDLPEFAAALYGGGGRDAAEHLFQVVAGADSMVLGEPQVQGQVKEAYERAKAAGTVGPDLHALFQRALSVGKEIRTRTGLARSHASIGSVAVDLAARVFQDLAGKTALLLGAGEMGTLALKHLAARGLDRILVANRTPARAEALAAEQGGRAVPWEALAGSLPEADVVLACADVPHAVLHAAEVERALKARRMRPILLLDLSVPRAIHPDVDGVEDAYLYNVDDLQRLAAEGGAARREALAAALAIARDESERFVVGLAERRVASAVAALRSRVEALGAEEIERVRARLAEGSPDAPEAAEEAIRRLLGKLLHAPIQALKEEARDGRAGPMLVLFQRLFDLPAPPDPRAGETDPGAPRV